MVKGVLAMLGNHRCFVYFTGAMGGRDGGNGYFLLKF